MVTGNRIDPSDRTFLVLIKVQLMVGHLSLLHLHELGNSSIVFIFVSTGLCEGRRPLSKPGTWTGEWDVHESNEIGSHG